jgi:mRNA deadenylase 3'-5' endonuclease subunit Ccr4
MSNSTLKVATWNVLADCYASGNGNNNSAITNWKKRKQSIQKILKLLSDHDLLFLQEVDHSNDFYRPLLISYGFECRYIQRPNKHDGCLIAYSKRKYSLVASEEVNFDDLTEKFHEMDIQRQSFRRHNVALIVCLRKDCQDEESCDQYVIASTAHLYWNPVYPEVKSGQSKYLLDRIAFFKTKLNLRCSHCSNSDSDSDGQSSCSISHPCPIILGGDFNSTPESEQYHLLTSYQPFVSKYVSTCSYCGLNSFPKQSTNSSSPSNLKPDLSHYFQGCYYGGNQTKFLCDPTLSKLCRWLRVLGLNSAMHVSNPSDSATSTSNASKASPKRNAKKGKQKKPANGLFTLHFYLS